MNPFMNLRGLLKWHSEAKPSQEWKPPLDLTPREWEDLKALRSDDAWDIWLKALDASLKFSGEALLGASTDESLHFHRGVIAGVRNAALLVDRLKAEEDAFLNGRKRQDAARGERAGRSTTLFGTPGWAKRT